MQPFILTLAAGLMILVTDAAVLPQTYGATSKARLSARQDTSGTPRPALGSVSYGADIRSCSSPGKIALTFDDGPGVYTSQLLDILAANSVKATFFIVGNSAGTPIDSADGGYAAQVVRMHTEGHQIGSHTYTHADLSTLTTEQRRQEMLQNEAVFVNILGFFPTYLRPPYTSCSAECYADIGALGYHAANYDLDTKDWEEDYDYSRNVFTSTITSSGPGASSWISLSHDIHEQTVTSFAQYTIDQARQAGYQLVTLGDCLGDPPANWYRDPVTGQAYA